MDFEKWEPIYKQILKDFGFDRQMDEKSAEVLSNLIKNKKTIDPGSLSELFNNKLVYIFGAGPNLKHEVEIDDFQTEFKGVIISADGATSALVENDIIPDVIVTDLDGKIEDQILANKKGAVTVIHAHGDNIDAIKKWVPKFENNLLGTSQSQPTGSLYNFGGFTDGDRAVFLAAHFKASKIELVAFDFEEPGEYSYQFNYKTKFKKLTWANGLIGMIVNPPVRFHPKRRR
jgi:uncharacterized Rossmann fold enzyme